MKQTLVYREAEETYTTLNPVCVYAAGVAAGYFLLAGDVAR